MANTKTNYKENVSSLIIIFAIVAHHLPYAPQCVIKIHRWFQIESCVHALRFTRLRSNEGIESFISLRSTCTNRSFRLRWLMYVQVVKQMKMANWRDRLWLLHFFFFFGFRLFDRFTGKFVLLRFNIGEKRKMTNTLKCSKPSCRYMWIVHTHTNTSF